MTTDATSCAAGRSTCPACGRVLPADAPAGNCPACLASLGYASAESELPAPDPSLPGEHGPIGIAATVFGAAEDGLRLEQPGDRIGRYKLLQKIGEGGCGGVYVAEQEEPVRRRVALKIIKPGMDSRQVIARFEAERQALAMMDHPNIAKVHDGGTTATGRPFFVMELVRGVRITEYCDENNLSTAQRLDLFTQVCHAVQHAHQKGIIHRDLKPSNILVTINDGVPVPKVIDFGVAKATEQRLTDKTIFTEFHQFIGTPAYMSPEQALMTSLDIDTRADIYSLGVLLYELLTGRTPLDTPEMLKAGLDEMRRTIREQDPPRPSNRLSTLPQNALTTAAKRRSTNPPQLIHAVSGDLDWIVMKCLEKDRTRRYETANGLAADIQRHLKHEPIMARPPGRFYTFRKLVRRNKTAFAAAAAVLLALLAGLAFSTWSLSRERIARREAGIEANKSRQVSKLLKDMIRDMRPSVAMGRDTTLLREFADKTAERLNEYLTDQPEVELELRRTLAQIYHALDDDRRAEALYRDTLPKARSLLAGDDPALAGFLREYAEVLVGRVKNAEAEAVAREALAIFRRHRGGESGDVATALHTLATVLAWQKKYDEATAAQEDSLAIDRRRRGPESRDVSTGMLGLAHIHERAGRPAEAEPLYREALAMRKRLTSDAHPSVIEATDFFAKFQIKQKNLAEAQSLLGELLAAQRKALGSENRMVAKTISQLLRVYDGEPAKAEPLARESMDLHRKLYGEESLEFATATNDLCVALRKLRRYAEAEPLLRKTLALLRRLLPGDSNRVDQTIFDLVLNLETQRKYAEAANVVQERLTLARLKAAEDPKLEHYVNEMARLLYRQKEFAKSEAVYREVIELRRKRHPAGDDDVAPVSSLARLLADWAWAERHGAAGATPGERGEVCQPLQSAREAERLLRECLAAREKKPDTSAWRLGDTKNRLGGAILSVAFCDPDISTTAREAKLVEAESLMLDGRKAMEEDGADKREYFRDGIERLVRLYEAWNKPDEASKCRAELEALDAESEKQQ